MKAPTKPAPTPPPVETVAARQAIIGDAVTAMEAAKRLKAAGYDYPQLDRLLKGEVA